MVRTKNTERKQPTKLPVARFPMVATGRAQRDRHSFLKSQLPPQDEELEWTALSPSLPGAASLELKRAVERINEEFAHPPPQNVEEVLDLVEDLHTNPLPPQLLELLRTKIQDLLTPQFEEDSVPTPLPPTITSETGGGSGPATPAPGQESYGHNGPSQGQAQPPHCSNQVPLEGVPEAQWGGGEEEGQKAKGPKCPEGHKEIPN